MAVKAWVTQDFKGGWSTDKKLGIDGSFAFSQSIDFRKKPSQMSILPGTRREDNGVFQDLLQNEVMANNGVIYGTGSNGFFYKRTTAGVWSVESTMTPGSFGIDYRSDTDAVYIPGRRSVSLYDPISNSPSMKPAYYGVSSSTYDNSRNAGFNVSSNQINGSKTTAIGTSIVEGQTTSRFFQSDIEPLRTASFYVRAKGTGDWTVTLHDGLNNTLATKTIANADLTNSAFNDFEFTGATNGQVRIYVKPNARTYHYHVTSTVNDGSVASSEAGDLSTCDLMTWADRMVAPTNGMHPMTRFLQYEVIGNSNYLSAWEPLSEPPTNDEWQRHRLVFPQEYEVCGVAVFNEYLAIATERITSSGQPQDGIIFFWDGLSSTYNYLTKIPEGSPQCIHEYKNVIYYFAGGAWYAISSPNSDPIKIRTMPFTDTEFSTVDDQLTIYPYAATVRRGIHLMAYPSATTNTNIQYGVYSWGSIDKNFPEAFGYNYILSTGSQTYSAQNNLKIGMVKNFGDVLHISWQDTLNGGYGVDVVDNDSTPASYAKWQGLIFDAGYVAKEKTANYIECYYDLPDGAEITLSYSLDRGEFITDDSSYSNDTLWQGQTGYARFNVPSELQARFHEFQPQIEVTCDSSVTTSPEIYMVALVFNNNKEEALV